jgi:hemerythrin-like domain-containing protein
MHDLDIENAIERLELLEHDHVLAGSLHPEVEELGQRYLATGSLEAAGVGAFRKAIASLVYIYKQHIEIEDNLVFPLAARLLSPTDKLTIANELAARRELRLVTSTQSKPTSALRAEVGLFWLKPGP